MNLTEITAAKPANNYYLKTKPSFQANESANQTSGSSLLLGTGMAAAAAIAAAAIYKNHKTGQDLKNALNKLKETESSLKNIQEKVESAEKKLNEVSTKIEQSGTKTKTKKKHKKNSCSVKKWFCNLGVYKKVSKWINSKKKS